MTTNRHSYNFHLKRGREVKVNGDIGSKKSRVLGLETKNDLLRIL